jgi:hypothetical protein
MRPLIIVVMPARAQSKIEPMHACMSEHAHLCACMQKLCMDGCIHVCMDVCMRPCMYGCTVLWDEDEKYVCLRVCMYGRVRVMHARMYAHMDVCMYVCMCTRVV